MSSRRRPVDIWDDPAPIAWRWILCVLVCCVGLSLGWLKVFNGYSVPSVTVESVLDGWGMPNDVPSSEAKGQLLSYVDEINSAKALDRILGPILLVISIVGLNSMHRVIGVEIEENAEINNGAVRR